MGRVLHGARRRRCPCCRRWRPATSARSCPPRRRSTARRGPTIVADLDRIVVPGHHPLAAPGLVRVLPGQRQRPEHPRRAGQRRPRHAGDAVVDGAGLHRARDARARLAGRPARPAPRVPLRLHRRRRHPALGVRRGAVRDRGGARAGGRRSGGARRVLLDADALLGGEGPARRRHPAPAHDRRRRRVRDAARRAGAPDRGRPRGRAAAVLLLRVARHHLVARVRSGARRSARSAATPGSGSTSTPRWPAWPPSARSTGG